MKKRISNFCFEQIRKSPQRQERNFDQNLNKKIFWATEIELSDPSGTINHQNFRGQ